MKENMATRANNPMVVAWLSISISISLTMVVAFHAPKEIAQKLTRDPQSLSLGSTDYGHIIHESPVAVFNPTSPSDIAALVNFSNSLRFPFGVAARGEGHSVYGQAMASGGVVVNMSNYRSNKGAIVVYDGADANTTSYVDAGGEQMWIDVLHATLERGLSPLSWTDYLYLTVAGTLSNAGISGQTFRFGPQIINVHELDVTTGKGEMVTCSAQNNPDLFYGVLGGLGQFGVITRARIALGPAPTRGKWLRLLYNDFSAFSADQEHLISINNVNNPSYLEGLLLLNQDPLDLSFYPESDHTRITSLLTQNHNILYVLELVKYYNNDSLGTIDKEVEEIVNGLRFVSTFKFEKDVTYEEFLNRVHSDELVLRSKGLWDIPHPWLNLFVPKSRILDFDEGVFKGIILNQNITAGVAIVYPVNRNKWDDRMSAVTPDEDIFYVVSLLHSSTSEEVGAYEIQNQMILKFCEENGIKIKQYLPQNKTLGQWKQHFGDKWEVFQQRKLQFDPKHILSPGQGIFDVNVNHD